MSTKGADVEVVVNMITLHVSAGAHQSASSPRAPNESSQKITETRKSGGGTQAGYGGLVEDADDILEHRPRVIETIVCIKSHRR